MYPEPALGATPWGCSSVRRANPKHHHRGRRRRGGRTVSKGDGLVRRSGISIERGGGVLATRDNLSLIRGSLDRMLESGDVRHLVGRLADDVEFSAPTEAGRGKAAVA